MGALSATVIAVVSAAGCTGGGKTPAATIDKNDTPLGRYADTVTITQVRSVNPNITFADGESIQNNFVSEFYLEKLNIKWEDKWTADPSAYSTKLNLDIASDELPDVCVVNANQLNTMVASGQALDLSEYYDHFATDKLKNNISEAAIASATYDGKLYAIPQMTSMESDSPIMWLRTDWMKKIGKSAPTTYAELVDYVKALKASGLVKNGKAGLNFYGPGSQAFAAIAGTQGAYYDMWIDDGTGKLVYSGVQPEMRAALKLMQDMYKDGLIDEDFAIKGSTEESLIAQGEYGVVFGQYFYGHLIKGSVLNDQNATWEAFPIPADADGNIIPQSKLNVGGYYVVNPACKNPEALIKSMNLWMEVWTKDGEYREWFTDTMLSDRYKDVYLCGEYALPSFFDVVDNNVNIGSQLREIYASSDPAKAAENYPMVRLTYNLIESHRSNFYQFVGGEGWALDVIYKTAEKVFSDTYKDFKYNLFNGVYSDDAQFYKTSLDTRMIETYYNIIMGGDISEFDTFAESWHKDGGDAVTDEVNKWYAEHK